MYNVGMFKFKMHVDKYGSLVPIEATGEVPFEIKRVYYIFDVPAEIRRGFHAHKKLHQVLICIKGSVKILVKTPEEEQIFELSRPDEGLYIGPMIWREMYDFSSDAVLLVLASDHYDPADYERNYDEYLNMAEPYFSRKP
jgi:dTDP-4-dehydrorhamnose 3,5-epimerase-like enzyme